MLILHLAMICVGIGAVVWGLPMAHRLKKPWDFVAALVMLSGVVLSLFGTLLTVVPDFFKQ
jgi:hypothetical protein